VPAPQSRVAANLRPLAICWLILSIVRLIPGLFLVLGADVATSFLPPDVPDFIPVLLHGIGIVFIAGAAIGLFAGWGLMERQPWARMLAIILGIFSLFDVPFGTALGVYTLWVLLPVSDLGP
jgi:O-antigen ligase